MGKKVPTAEVGKSRELLGPGEFLQHAAQVDHVVRARDRGQWRGVGPQEGQPNADMGVAGQVIQREKLRMLSAEISQKKPNGSARGGEGRVTPPGRHPFRPWPEGTGHK